MCFVGVADPADASPQPSLVRFSGHLFAPFSNCGRRNSPALLAASKREEKVCGIFVVARLTPV
jgi:hypothetical protein